MMLEIQGQHFNTGNIGIQVFSGGSVVSSTTVTAVAGSPGKLAGSFDEKAYVACPSANEELFIQLTDECTGNVVGYTYP
jgi:hypothetical protein